MRITWCICQLRVCSLGNLFHYLRLARGIRRGTDFRSRHMHGPLWRMLMKYNALIFLTLLTTLGCAQSKSQEENVLDKQIPHGQRIALRQIKKWNFGFDTVMTRDFSFVRELSSKPRARIMKITGTDYSGLLLLTFDQEDKVIDSYEVAGGECDGGYDQVDKELLSCQFKQAIINSDKDLTIRKVQEVIPIGQKTGHLKVSRPEIGLHELTCKQDAKTR